MAPAFDPPNYDDYDSGSDSAEDSTHGCQTDIVIAVMGCTGTGKSSFIKLLTGNTNVRIGDSLESETSEVQVIRFLDRPSGRNVTIVDTPGFDDSRAGVTDTDILKTITDYLLKEYDEHRKLNGLIYLQRISDPRFGGQSSRNLRMFRELCGTAAYKNVVVLTTFWDQVATSEGARREAQLKSNFFKDLVAGGARFMRHDRTLGSARQVLRHLLPMPPTVTQIQVNIREQGMSLEETPAGSVHSKEVELAIAKYKEEVADLTAEMATVKESNKAVRRELEAERAELRQALARWENERSVLKEGLDEEREFRKRLEAEGARMQTQFQQEMKPRGDIDAYEKELLRRREAIREAIERALRDARQQPFNRRLKIFAEDVPLLPNCIGKPVLGAVGMGLDVLKGIFH